MKTIICLLTLQLFIVLVTNAQNVGIGTLTPQAPLTVAANKTVLFGSDTLNAGTKMMWLPEKSAFRVGTVGTTIGSGVNWNADSIGLWSFASGSDTKAKGDGSTAMGIRTHATGWTSTAMGFGTIASGGSSTAMGYFTTASGLLSTAMGLRTVSKAFASLSIGQYNDSIASSNNTLWVPTDPLLIAGNGTSNTARSNALVVYKNGNTDISGFTRLGEAAEAAPKIKMKELSLTSAATATGQSPINHGLNSSKIISVTTLMEWTTGFFAPVEYSPDPLLRYNYFVSPTQIIIQNNAANCTYICSKPVKILITYKE